MQIFVVDNDADSRYLCKILFESYGATVTTTEFVADALTLLDSFTPDILVCEIRIMDEDIWPLIHQIRAVSLSRSHIIPILLASAYCRASFAQDFIANAESHLLKPFDVESLVDEVWNLVHLSKTFFQPHIQDWVANHKTWEKHQTAEISLA
ncbi:response regulator [Leptolyngbya sp. CCNP1308]|uniref:response regulator n=1 Tax=Leptolyngbya sp. CCNP1308 TaxID=3110255 RepID=UPI002B1EE32B|nr:response regulator [Leptolyngbya sp. CCNP1308]MEA5451585.1 response regulator [Leptolyngbya sp. CCNP1308]